MKATVVALHIGVSTFRLFVAAPLKYFTIPATLLAWAASTVFSHKGTLLLIIMTTLMKETIMMMKMMMMMKRIFALWSLSRRTGHRRSWQRWGLQSWTTFPKLSPPCKLLLLPCKHSQKQVQPWSVDGFEELLHWGWSLLIEVGTEEPSHCPTLVVTNIPSDWVTF